MLLTFSQYVVFYPAVNDVSFWNGHFFSVYYVGKHPMRLEEFHWHDHVTLAAGVPDLPMLLIFFKSIQPKNELENRTRLHSFSVIPLPVGCPYACPLLNHLIL